MTDCGAAGHFFTRRPQLVKVMTSLLSLMRAHQEIYFGKVDLDYIEERMITPKVGPSLLKNSGAHVSCTPIIMGLDGRMPHSVPHPVPRRVAYSDSSILKSQSKLLEKHTAQENMRLKLKL